MIIGLTGRIASGKGVIVEYLKGKGFEYITMSNIITQELISRNMEITRANLQLIGNEIRAQYGPGALMARAIHQMETGKNYIIDGIRNPGEVQVLKEKGDFYLIAIDADQKIRYERFLLRSKDSDPKTWEEFLIYDEREFFNAENPNAQQVGKCMEMANFHITNNGNLEEFIHQINTSFNSIKA